MKPPVAMNGLATNEADIRSVVDAVHAEPNGEAALVERRIQEFEAQFGFSSDEMVARLKRGQLRPTLEVEAWIMALRVRDDLGTVKTRGR